jgi:hypothetical protein
MTINSQLLYSRYLCWRPLFNPKTDNCIWREVPIVVWTLWHCFHQRVALQVKIALLHGLSIWCQREYCTIWILSNTLRLCVGVSVCVLVRGASVSVSQSVSTFQFLYGTMDIYVWHGNYLVNSKSLYEVGWKIKGLSHERGRIKSAGNLGPSLL